MNGAATLDTIEAAARDSYGRLVAYIASRTGNIADAEDALSEASARPWGVLWRWGKRAILPPG